MGSGLSPLVLVLVVFFKLLMFSLSISGELYEGSDCKLENGKMGVCLKIYDCPSRLQEVMERKRTYDSAGRCGFDNFTEIVCCKLNVTEKIGLRPAEIACRQYENEIASKEVPRAEDVVFHIFGGTPAVTGEFPYMVALGYKMREEDEEDANNTNGIQYNCGGTLISSQHVLTAAHCVSNVQERRPIEVRVGSEDLNSNDSGQRIPIREVMTHPRFKRSMNYNDVAILRLSTPVRMTSRVRPICILTKPLSNMVIPQNTSFVVTGWGATSLEVERSSKLMKTPSLSLVDRTSCAESYEGLLFSKLPRGLDESLVCALDLNSTRGADACQGDSGGPLLMVSGPNHSVVGVTAFGQLCGGSTPGIYTAVYSYLEWIERQVWPEMADER